MKETLIQFTTAKLAKEKGFNIETLYFYTKPNSKMFGTDEKGRLYPIKNISKKLYKCGENAVLNIENVYSAPTQSLLQKYLREVHKINIEVRYYGNGLWRSEGYKITPNFEENNFKELFLTGASTYELTLEEGLFQVLNLIKV